MLLSAPETGAQEEAHPKFTSTTVNIADESNNTI